MESRKGVKTSENGLLIQTGGISENVIGDVGDIDNKWHLENRSRSRAKVVESRHFRTQVYDSGPSFYA